MAALYVLAAPTALVALYASTDLLALQAVLFRVVQDAFICKTKTAVILMKKESRCILHCDLNNFFASVECLSNPRWRDVPMAVCGDTDQRHGIVLAKNEPAKKYGIKTGDTVWQAKKKCAGVIIAPTHFDRYVFYSKEIRKIYGRYTDMIEPFGLDECWLDVGGSKRLFGSGEQIADNHILIKMICWFI